MNNISSKMVAVMKECNHVIKKGTNEHYDYNYATCADVLAKVNAAFVKYGISTLAMPELISMEKVTTLKGHQENLATVKVSVLIIDTESGETITIAGLGSGQDSGDKAVMKAQTAAIKYAYLLSLAISTEDDPENENVLPETKTDTCHYERSFGENAAPVSTNSYKRKAASSPKTSCLCVSCGAEITRKVKEFSESRYGRPLCMDCQKSIRGSA